MQKIGKPRKGHKGGIRRRMTAFFFKGRREITDEDRALYKQVTGHDLDGSSVTPPRKNNRFIAGEGIQYLGQDPVTDEDKARAEHTMAHIRSSHKKKPEL